MMDESRFATIAQLYKQGLYLQAYQHAQVCGPLASWRGAPARRLAARLAGQLGDSRLANTLCALAWREHRRDPRAVLAYAWALGNRRGPYDAWRFLRRHADLKPAHPLAQSEWLGAHVQVLSTLRDFERAEQCLAEAECLAPDHPWVFLARVMILARQDRWEDAVATGRRLLQLQPWFHPGVEATAHALVQTGQMEEALELLRAAAQHLESGSVVRQLLGLLVERRCWNEAAEAIERIVVLEPLMRPQGFEWVESVRAEVAYHRGDRNQAIEHARAVRSSGFFQAIAQRLTTGSADSRAVLLDVPYVHQHFHTCAPATLASIGPYWSMPVDHEQVAETICYDGTPDHKDRYWAETNGWIAREFTVTWAAAATLLDRGIPFTLATVQPTAAHLQAVIGYDTARGTLFVRDPAGCVRREYLVPEWLDAHRSTGPRGMALVPCAEAARLEGIELPETTLYDRLYALKSALERHDRAAAWHQYVQLAQEYPTHAFTHRARWVIAAYDDDATAILDCVERLLEQFPDDQILWQRKLRVLQDLGRREERRRFLHDVCTRRLVDPAFWLDYAQELLTDARQWNEAERRIRVVRRARPQDAAAYWTLATLRLAQRRFLEALEQYRFAGCLAPMNEPYALQYAATARLLKRSDDALALLRDRCHRLGSRSGAPAVTLYTALTDLGRNVEAFHVLDQALRARPEDDQLALFTAREAARFGNHERAAALLRAAEGKVRRNTWLRASACVREAHSDTEGALPLWRELVAVEPLAVDAHEAVARLLARTAGRSAALAYLADTAARLPYHLGLHRLYATWLSNDDSAERKRILTRMLEQHPTDAWTWRELALLLSGQGRHGEARQRANELLRLDPHSPASHSVNGWVAFRDGAPEDARRAFQTAISLSVDHTPSLHGLLATCRSREDTIAALHFVEVELERQTVFGDGLQVYREAARAVFTGEEVLQRLQAALAARPDLPPAWSQTIQQLLAMDRLNEAAPLSEQATERFPLSAELWMDRAAVAAAEADRPAHIAALERAIAIAPASDVIARLLSSAYEEAGDLDAAQRILDAAVKRTPQGAANHGCLASVLWKKGDRTAACERLRQALRIDPKYHWGWQQLRQWFNQLGNHGNIEELAREIAADHAGEPEAWLAVARELQSPSATEERLAALDRALAIQPQFSDAHDLRATILAEAGRFDEACAACAPAVFDDALPITLRGRRAWIEHRRGNRARAVEMMKAALEVDPAYPWGWQQLADWAAKTGDLAGALQAAEHLVRLQPGNAVAWGYLGEARTAMGDSAGARRALRRAFDMDPDYLWAGLNLFDAEMREGHLPEAAAVLDVLSRRAQSDAVLMRAVTLAAARDDAETAVQRFRQQCEVAGDEVSLESSWKTLEAHGWLTEAGAALTDVVRIGQPSGRAATLWVSQCVARRDWRQCEAASERLLDGHAAGVPAAAKYLTGLYECKEHRRLSQFVQRTGTSLRQHTLLWGHYGYLLLQMRRRAQCAEWMADWRERQDVEAWMLVNLIAALRHLDRWEEARAAGLHAESLPAAAAIRGAVTVWLAVDDALAGDAAECDRRLAGIVTDSLLPHYRCLHTVASGVREVERAEPRDRSRVFRDVRPRIAHALWAQPGYSEQRALVLAVQRGARQIAACCGNMRSRLWAWRCAVTP